jgi:hypothetical protein
MIRNHPECPSQTILIGGNFPISSCGKSQARKKRKRKTKTKATARMTMITTTTTAATRSERALIQWVKKRRLNISSGPVGENKALALIDRSARAV